MKKSANSETRYRVMFSLVVLGLIAAVIILPNQFHSIAGNAGQDGSERTVSQQPELENYDIRTDKSQAETLLGFRQTAGKSAVAVADSRDAFVTGENALRQSVPTLKIEYNNDIRTPEVIAPDVNRGRAFLTGASKEKHAEILRDFAADNASLVGLRGGQAQQLHVTADYTNPNGNLSYAHLEQLINGVPVFRSEIKAGFTKNGEMFRVINNLAPDLEYSSLSTDFGDPLDAVRATLSNLNYQVKAADLNRNQADSTDLKTVFGTGDWATTAEKMYFPTEPGVARTAWRVLIWEPINAYYVIVDAQNGTILWRKNLAEDQTQAATYNVYTNPLSMVNVAESPAPITPAPTSPSTGIQGTQISRNTVTLIGNEGDVSFNNLGWMTDGANGGNGWTDGNAVQAGLDLVAPNGIDASVSGTNRVLSFDYNPAPGMPAPPDDVTSTTFRNGIVTQLFYINNRYHDEMYKLGFTEAARNFQNDNFGRGGLAGDRVSAEAQDYSGTNNANFAAGADGARGRMQMYRFTQTPARDGDLDADIVIHEHTHGLSNRLVGNNSGLSINTARGMGEGWSDFYGLSLLSQASDSVNAVYTTGAYATYNVFGIGTTNSYYGIRRFPYAIYSSTGGPNNRPFNPLTYADINTGCVINDGAYAPSAPFATSNCSEVHNIGEVWSSMLWEVRAKMVTRLGFTLGNRQVLQLVTDGLKLTPNGPNFIQARDAIIAAAQTTSAEDVVDIREGFRIRGAGFSAREANGVAVEAFDQPNVTLADGFVINDATGDNDGYPEPGETVSLNVPIINESGSTINNVSVSVSGGGSADYGSIIYNQTVSRQINLTIPASAACGSLYTITLNITSSNGSRTETRTFRLGAPQFTGTLQNFDGVTAPALPVGWTQTNTGSSTGWVTATDLVNSAPNTAFTPAPASSSQAILNTSANITSASAQLSFKTFYNTEPTWDGMLLEIQSGNGPFQNITTAGGSFVSGGYNTMMNASSPFGAILAWSGTSAAYVNTVVNLPASVNGLRVNLRWRAETDTADTAASGTPAMRIDDVAITGGTLLSSYDCSTVVATISKTRADFDGDGRTDFSVFRPDSGIWYLQRSQTGFGAVSWGTAGDKLVPGDYDGDGKTDFAVARNNAANTAKIFYIMNSGTSTATTVQFGFPSDIPVVSDYDSDGKADIAVFRPSNGYWYILNSGSANSLNSVQFGQNGDLPVPADYDGDSRADLAVFRNGIWYINKSTGGVQTTNFGLGSDLPVPADYDGDGRVNIAVYRPSNGTWYTSLNAANNFGAVQFGNATDVPVPGDYDGDGKSDVAVFRGGTWYVNKSTGGLQTIQFGASTDLPIPKQYIP